VRSRILLLVVSVGVFKLSGGNFSSFDWLISVLSMYRWLVLRHRRTDSRDRSVRCGILLGIYIVRMLKLFRWNVFRGLFNDSLLKLSRRNLHCISIKYLHELLCGFLSGLDGLDSMFGLHFRLLLRDNGSTGCNRDMCDRKVFIFLVDLMYKLRSRILSVLNWLFCVLFMYCRLVLCHHRTNSCNRSVRCGIFLFSCVDSVL